MASAEHLNEVLQEFHRDHSELMFAGGDPLSEGISRALDMVPSEGVEWAIVQRHPVLLIRSAATLFQIRLDPREGSVTLTSRPLDGERLAVGLDWGDVTEAAGDSLTRESRWSFRYEGVVGEEEWQRISGRVTTTPSGEILDRREHFARNLAAQAGWTPAGLGA
jgi:hypothetical protein